MIGFLSFFWCKESCGFNGKHGLWGLSMPQLIHLQMSHIYLVLGFESCCTTTHVSLQEFCTLGALQMFYVSGVSRNCGHILPILCWHACCIVLRTSLAKHKLKDKIIKDFRAWQQSISANGEALRRVGSCVTARPRSWPCPPPHASQNKMLRADLT